MITSNIIHRVFRIGSESSHGTAFTIDVGGREYLVTAKHVVQSQPPEKPISIFGNGNWNEISTRLVGHGKERVDISVFLTEQPLSPSNLPVIPSSDGLVYGQEVFFLGFPFDGSGSVIFAEQGYPLPFVKRATFSCFAGDEFWLDGHNNRGFSGGPVVFGRSGSLPDRIAAVISGYFHSPEPVYCRSAETQFHVQNNMGIIESFKIEKALDLIKSNPNGDPF